MLFHFGYFIIKGFIRLHKHLVCNLGHILVHISSDGKRCFKKRPVHARTSHCWAFFYSRDRGVSWLGVKDFFFVWMLAECLDGVCGRKVNISLRHGSRDLRLHLLIMRGACWGDLNIKERTNTLTRNKLTRYLYKSTHVLQDGNHCLM